MLEKNVKTNHSILGRGWSFPVNFNIEEDSVDMVGSTEDIEQSLQILLNTLPGERVTNLKYGCKIKDILFHPIDSQFEVLAVEAIQDAIDFFEPRIRLDDVKLNYEDQVNGLILLELNYIVKLTNSRHNLVHPFSKIEANI